MQVLEEHFDAAFAAPDGIKKLRELILTLAMQGKLAAQNPDDQPASELLEEIEAEKRRLVAEGKIKAPKPLPPIEADEMPYEVPVGWEWVSFGEIAQHNSGKTLDSSRNSGKPTRYITTSNLYWGRFSLENVREMLIEDNELERCSAIKGDLLICEGGEAGRSAVWDYDETVCFQNHIHRARFYGNILPLFAYKFFEKLNFTGEIENYRKGVGISNMSSKSLGSILFPLPPLAEQRRIVARIDDLMARCDELEALRASREQKRLDTHAAALNALLSARAPDAFAEAWQFVAEQFSELHSAPKNVAELRKAVLQLAVMGKLVPQDPSDPPARELLKEIDRRKTRILRERQVKYREILDHVDTEKTRFTIPDSWSWMRFSDAVFYQEGPGIRNWQFRNSGIKLLNVSNILTDDSLNFDKSDKFVSLEEFDEKYKHFEIIEGDLLFAGSGASWGKIAWFKNPGYRIMLNTSTMRLSFFHSDFEPNYLFYFLKTEIFKQQLTVQLVGLQPNFGSTHVGRVYIPIPPLSEQRRIVAKIDQLMALCDMLEAGLAAQTGKQSELLNAVMAAVTPASTTPTRRAAPDKAKAAWTDPEANEAAEPEPKRRGRPAKVQTEAAGVAGEVAAPRRRGRPPKNPVAVSASIPSAASEADAIRRLEELKLERAKGTRQVGLFEVEV